MKFGTIAVGALLATSIVLTVVLLVRVANPQPPRELVTDRHEYDPKTKALTITLSPDRAKALMDELAKHEWCPVPGQPKSVTSDPLVCHPK